MKLVILVLALFLTACQTPAVVMKHPNTENVVQCGPYSKSGYVGAVAAAQHEAQCIQDFKEQGYVRWQG